MKRIVLDNPPIHRGNDLAFFREVTDWMSRTKTKIDQASLQNDTPLTKNFTVTGFTTSTALSGTSTGTDITNFVCSVVQAFTNKGIITTQTSTL